MSRVTLAVPTYRRYDLLAQLLVPSAERGTRAPDRYYIVDNGGSLDPAAYGLPTVKTEIYRAGRNLGVGPSWNHVMKTQVPEDDSEIVIFACDDMDLWPTTIEKLVEAAEAQRDVGFFFPQHNAHTMFGVFLMRRWLHQSVGDFDENLWPAYFEDNDYVRRMNLAGIKSVSVPDCGMNHVGSGTLKSFNEDELNEHHSRFEGLRLYYTRKWGGDPGHESFTVPFDGKK